MTDEIFVRAQTLQREIVEAQQYYNMLLDATDSFSDVRVRIVVTKNVKGVPANLREVPVSLDGLSVLKELAKKNLDELKEEFNSL